MSAQPIPSDVMTLGEYYVFENASEERHDYDSGRIVAMSGASDSHIRICFNVGAEIRNRLKGRSCEGKGSDYRIGFPGRTFTHYPDVAIVCGGSERDPRDKSGQTYTNPTAIVEVQSPTTTDFDRGTKFDRYRTLESFREYVVIFQDRPEIQTFFKRDDGTWLFRTFTGLTATAPLESVGIDLHLAEVFDRVTFDAATDDAAAAG